MVRDLDRECRATVANGVVSMIAAFGRRCPTTVPRALVARLALLALFLGAALGVGPRTAGAETSYGYDISWPQCSTALGGYGLPLPPTSAQFVIIGLTRGLPFTKNPCLGTELSWATTNRVPAQAYTFAAFPTAAQYTAYRAAGPWSSSTRAGALSNVGYAEAKYAVSTLAAAGMHPSMVWIDVEDRSTQEWPEGSALRIRENRFVIEGVMRGLRDAGYSYGLYSNRSSWQSITGGWWLPGVPVWATVGLLGYPTEALDACGAATFSGGHPYLVQWWDNQRDYDLTCDPYAFTALPTPPSSLGQSTGDFSGDWKVDLLARNRGVNSLFLYAGTERGTFAASRQIGTHWGAFDLLETPGDLTGDGAGDVIARRASTGELMIYRGNGRGGFAGASTLAVGMGQYASITGVGDFTGDQRNDLLALDAVTGYLWLYAGDGAGGLAPPVQVGRGWVGLSPLLGPGDVNGDGFADVIARQTSTGYLWLYPGNGSGGWLPRVRIGVGWGSLTAVAAPGDLTGDRVPDVVGRDSAGTLWVYPRTAAGGWLSRIRIGAGWEKLNALF